LDVIVCVKHVPETAEAEIKIDATGKAIEKTVDYVREKHEVLNFLGDLEVMTLIGTSRKELADECGKYVDRYNPDLGALVGANPTLDEELYPETEYRNNATDALVSHIEKIQEGTSTTPIEVNDTFSYTYAFRLITSAVLSQDFHQLKILMEQKIRREMSWGFEKYVPIGFAIMLIFCGIGVLMFLGG